VKTAAAFLVFAIALPAAAQDIRGLEACMAEKQIERRTGCLQANVELLQQTIIKQARDTQSKIAAANAEIATLKARLTKLEDELAILKKAKAAEPPPKK
jgi:hypothetical protein